MVYTYVLVMGIRAHMVYRPLLMHWEVLHCI